MAFREILPLSLLPCSCNKGFFRANILSFLLNHHFYSPKKGWFFRKKVEIDYPVSGVKKYTSDLSQLW
jgi:hypothetical protein